MTEQKNTGFDDQIEEEEFENEEDLKEVIKILNDQILTKSSEIAKLKKDHTES